MAGGRRRLLVVVGLVVVAVLVLGIVLHRTFAARDTVRTADGAYPALPEVSAEVYGALLHAPLLVDGRLRLYAGEHSVWADQPATKKSSLTPYWSLRRWPGQVLGVVVAGTTVVSQWSDGQLFGTDARTGRLLWKAATPIGRGEHYTGRRTGAGTVYSPAHLRTVGNAVVVHDERQMIVLDGATGTRLWSAQQACPVSFFTTTDLVICVGQGVATARSAATGAPVNWPPAGSPTSLGGWRPFGCGPAWSGCQGVRGQGRAVLIGPGGDATPVQGLDSEASWLVGGVVVRQLADGTVTGSTPDGRALWHWADPPPPGSPGAPSTVASGQPVPGVIATGDGRVHLLTADRDLVTLDPADGLEVSRFSLLFPDHRAFQLGHVYAGGGFVVIERLRPTARPSDADPAYYFPNPGVLLAGS